MNAVRILIIMVLVTGMVAAFVPSAALAGDEDMYDDDGDGGAKRGFGTPSGWGDDDGNSGGVVSDFSRGAMDAWDTTSSISGGSTDRSPSSPDPAAGGARSGCGVGGAWTMTGIAKCG